MTAVCKWNERRDFYQIYHRQCKLISLCYAKFYPIFIDISACKASSLSATGSSTLRECFFLQSYEGLLRAQRTVSCVNVEKSETFQSKLVNHSSLASNKFYICQWVTVSDFGSKNTRPTDTDELLVDRNWQDYDTLEVGLDLMSNHSLTI